MIGVLLENMAPLYILVALGYIAGRYLEVNLHSLATVAIYIVSPVVIFGALLKLEFTAAYLLLPALIYVCGVLAALLAYKTSHLYFKDNMANLIGMSAGTANTGYFGLPIVVALFGVGATGVYILMNVGIILYEVTCGYYIGARGNHDVKESLKKVVKLPAFHATWLGLLCNLTNTQMPEVFYTYWQNFMGAWVVIGMMLVGIALAHVKKLRINPPMLGWMFGFRYIFWPVLLGAFVYCDKAFLGLYNDDIHKMVLLVGLVPMAANIVAFASTLDIRPGEAATAVLLTTCFSFFYLPLVLWLLF